MNLSTIITKIQAVPNPTNAALLNEFYDYMRRNGAGEHHIRNELYASIQFAMFLGKDVTFNDVNKKTQITDYLDTRRKTKDVDPDERWKTTWNDYLDAIRHFFRWLHNQRGKEDLTDPREWETPSFTKIKKQKTKRLSPYSELEIWDRDDILLLIKYATHIRNKAALGLFWDLDARNHEVTTIRIKNVRLKERYAEGEVPYETKTGSGPVLLTLSFPYVRDWLNIHPFANDPNSRIIVSLNNGAPVKPTAMWSMMQQLKERIARLIKKNMIKDPVERERLEHLLKTKRWNPYCIRHSAITYDSDSLPEFALRKKVRWSMNSKQPGRYIKRRLGDGLKRQILEREGIIITEEKDTATVHTCPRCNLSNALENRVCSRCGYPLSQEALDEIKAREKEEMKRALVELLSEHPELMVEKFGKLHGYAYNIYGFGATAGATPATTATQVHDKPVINSRGGDGGAGAGGDTHAAVGWDRPGNAHNGGRSGW